MPLEDDPFAFTITRSGEVRITRAGRLVTVLRGAAAARFVRRSAGQHVASLQPLLARATGNYRRGNERR